jgi:hypothetical protein
VRGPQIAKKTDSAHNHRIQRAENDGRKENRQNRNSHLGVRRDPDMMLLRPKRETRQQSELPVRPVETEACGQETDREDSRRGN